MIIISNTFVAARNPCNFTLFLENLFSLVLLRIPILSDSFIASDQENFERKIPV